MRNILIFVGSFVIGALLVLSARTARAQPFAPVAEPAAMAPAAVPMPVAGPMPTAGPMPVAASATPTAATTSTKAMFATAAMSVAENTKCSVCGMKVDPELPSTQWHGHTIGFGCAACPPKFAANPDRYGQAALENRKAP